MEKWIYAGLFVAILVGSHAMAYKVGTLSGALEVKTAWDKAEKQRTDKIQKLETDYALLEGTHQQKIKELSDALKASTDEFQTTLNGYRTEYDHRLQLATSRAGVYQRQAQGTAAERDSLAEHAAQLDRSLEEGRGLVRELRETLGQREVTIRTLGGIILSDRTLLESN